MMKRGTITVDGTPLVYDVRGEGEPLVLVHGGLGDRRMWDDQMEAFSEFYRVIRYDQHGYGDSPMPPGAVAYHEDLYRFLAALGIARAHILGLSYGARVATDFTLTHPEMVMSFVSVSSVIAGISDSTMRRIDLADAAAGAGDLDRAVELELQIWIDGVGRRPDEVSSAVRERVRDMNYEVWKHSTSDVEVVEMNPPARNRLSEIRAPTLIVVGELDIPDVMATADLLQREIPAAQRVTIPAAAHHPQMEQPAIFNEAILAFLPQVKSDPAPH